jgi:hypothetical protein
VSPAELAGAALPAALAGSPDDKVAACQVLQELLTDVDLTFTTAPAAPLLEEAAVRQKRGRGQQPAGCASPEVAAEQSRGTRQPTDQAPLFSTPAAAAAPQPPVQAGSMGAERSDSYG